MDELRRILIIDGNRTEKKSAASLRESASGGVSMKVFFRSPGSGSTKATLEERDAFRQKGGFR
jgi:hypothetical protein